MGVAVSCQPEGLLLGCGQAAQPPKEVDIRLRRGKIFSMPKKTKNSSSGPQAPLPRPEWIARYFLGLNAAASAIRHDIMAEFPTEAEFHKHEAELYSSEIETLAAMAAMFAADLEHQGFMSMRDMNVREANFKLVLKIVALLREQPAAQQDAVQQLLFLLEEMLDDDDDEDGGDEDLESEDEAHLKHKEAAEALLSRCSKCQGRTEVLSRDREDLPRILGTSREQIDSTFDALGPGTEACLCLKCGHASIKGPPQSFGSWAKNPRA